MKKRVIYSRILASILVSFFVASIVCSSLNAINLSREAKSLLFSKKENTPTKVDSQLLYEEKEKDFDAESEPHDFLFFIAFLEVPVTVVTAQLKSSYGQLANCFSYSYRSVPLYLAHRTFLI